MAEQSGFDYEVEHKCQYDVSDTNEECDCREPAPYKVWWTDSGGSSEPMWLCPEHFKHVRNIETGQPVLPNPSEEQVIEEQVEAVREVVAQELAAIWDVVDKNTRWEDLTRTEREMWQEDADQLIVKLTKLGLVLMVDDQTPPKILTEPADTIAGNIRGAKRAMINKGFRKVVKLNGTKVEG